VSGWRPQTRWPAPREPLADALAVAGAAIVVGRPLNIGLPAAVRVRALPSGGYARVAGFGISYAIASLSCAFAVVLAVAGQATAAADPVQFAIGLATVTAAGAVLFAATRPID